jgi:hypothetical protein
MISAKMQWISELLNATDIPIWQNSHSRAYIPRNALYDSPFPNDSDNAVKGAFHAIVLNFQRLSTRNRSVRLDTWRVLWMFM